MITAAKGSVLTSCSLGAPERILRIMVVRVCTHKLFLLLAFFLDFHCGCEREAEDGEVSLQMQRWTERDFDVMSSCWSSRVCVTSWRAPCLSTPDVAFRIWWVVKAGEVSAVAPKHSCALQRRDCLPSKVSLGSERQFFFLTGSMT